MTPTLFDLSGKAAIVTGSSRGIGRSIAEQLAAAGASVMISSRNLDACVEVRDAIRTSGGRAEAIACHVGSKDALQAMLDATLAAFGRLDVCVANVAVNPYYGPLSGIGDDAWDKIMGTNVRSTLWLAQMALPHLAAAGGGSFQIVSSVAALRASTALPAYGVSKLAEIGLMQNLALEWGPKNIRINAILPGVIDTDFASALTSNPKLVDAVRQRTPLGRIGDPIDIGGIALFLASPAARFITGQTLVADGGASIVDALL